MLVAETGDGSVRKLVDDSNWLSLGEIVGRERTIPPNMQEALIRTLNGYQKLASDQKAEGIYIFATEAVRAASNSREVLKRIEQACGLKVEIISGQREAEFGLRGVLLDSGFSSFILAEVGGGSAQVAQCSRKRIKSEASLSLGTGTLIAKLGLSCPCDYAHLKRTQRLVEETLATAEVLEEGGPLVACGGVARGLWRALHPDGNRILHVEELNFLIWSTQRLTSDQIVQRFQVKPKRARTLFPGAVVYKQIMERSGQEEMTISRFGVREGALLEMAEGKVSAWRV